MLILLFNPGKPAPVALSTAILTQKEWDLPLRMSPTVAHVGASHWGGHATACSRLQVSMHRVEEKFYRGYRWPNMITTSFTLVREFRRLA